MSEQKKLYILLGIVIVFVVTLVGFNFINEYRSKKYLEDFEKTISSNEQEIILVGRDTCAYCQLFKPLLNYMSETYDFKYLYVETDKISSKGLNNVLDKLNIDANQFGTPHLSLVKAGNVIDEIAGYVDENELLEFLKKNGYADENATLPINYIDFDEYKKLTVSETPEIIVIGQTGCSYCMLAKPALLSIAKKYNVKINYFNMTILSESDDKTSLLEEFESSLAYLQDAEWGTPLMLIVKDGEVMAASNGFTSEENYIKFLNEQGLIGDIDE